MISVFDILTREYDEWYDSKEGSLVYESELLCLKSLIEKDAYLMLEIGVGTGRFGSYFKGTVGIDPSLNALKFAKKRGVTVVQGIGECLPFKDRTFDYVILIVTLCFVQNPIDVLKESKRVLKERGSVIIGIISSDSAWGVFYEDKRKKGHPFYSMARFYSFKELKEMFKKVGLNVISIKSTLFQKPHAVKRIEYPIDGFREDAGFICIKLRKLEEV